ncbi:MAG TPA: L-fucose:H+ symporter permease [Acidobacteriaceae bacterium]|nr:L-fucose:H+ symporter permease [Acidobacteriaceae bacterium]
MRRAPVFPAGHILPFALVTAIFFLWGMSNNLTDILVQQFRKSFQLSLIEAQLVQTAVFLAYGTMAIPAALIMRRFGYKAGILIGLATFGMGTLLFWPAGVIGQYLPFLLALFVCGCGQSILETACNPFMAQFGPPETSEQRLNFAQAFNPPGTITGVLIGTWFIFSGVEKTPDQVAAMKAAGTYTGYLHTEILRVVPTYVVLGLVVLSLAALIGKTKFPKMHSEHEGEGGDHGRFGALFGYPHLMLAVAAQFFYVGAQVTTWSTFIPYVKAYTAVSERDAGYFLTGTLVALGVGRFVSTSLMKLISPVRMMTLYAVINVALLAVGIARPGMTGVWAILATSFFMSIMFPTIFALGVKGLGPNTKLGGSLIVMSILGGALFPPLSGVLARGHGIALAYVLPLSAYVVVALFGLIVPQLLPPAGNTDPNAGILVAEYGQGI